MKSLYATLNPHIYVTVKEIYKRIHIKKRSLEYNNDTKVIGEVIRLYTQLKEIDDHFNWWEDRQQNRYKFTSKYNHVTKEYARLYKTED